jgi:DNA-directed RNA polymerase specialized sigma24 family protein
MTSGPRPEPGRSVEKHAAPGQARDAIEALNEADYTKLMLIAKGFAKTRLRGSVLGPEDLIQDAITKTLDGRRRWNTSVSIIKHLDRVMESDAGHEAAMRVARDVHELPEDAAEPAAQQPGPEARLQALDEIEDLLALFAGDQPALEFLGLKGAGLSASEIQCELGIGKTQYDTITKRIRRRLAKHLADRDN